MKKLTAIMALCLMACLLFAASALSEAVSRNPLLTPPVLENYIETPDELLNILILGIDYGGDVYKSSAKKHLLEEGHTDAMMVVSINMAKGTLSLVSLPRDSLTYIPGVRGIYKANAAINCGETIEEGLQLACDAVSWHLGGVRIDKYVAVDAAAMVALGDAIGGIDFEMDIGLTVDEKYYKRGMQHLDGKAMLYYLRARKHATTGRNDIARTGRQRQMIQAIYEKIVSDPSLVTKILSVVTSGEENIFMNLSLMDLLPLVPVVLGIDLDNVENYVLTGDYLTFMKCFTFNDQQHRQDVIREVFGVEVEEKQYVSFEYSKWLTRHGLTAAKFINNAKAIMDYARAAENPNAEQQTALAELEAAYDAAIYAFDDAADSMNEEDAAIMNKAVNALKDRARDADGAFAYPQRVTWSRTEYWYTDEMINEKVLNWN